nr:unnamed protein product [Callosobruchus chinensis]
MVVSRPVLAVVTEHVMGNSISLLSNFGKESAHVIKRGLLWQQRDRLFSRWKERYFVLTKDYLHCFRRASGADRISEMGQFLFKVKLVDIVRIEWENKKTYSTVALVLGRDGKIYLRAAEGLEDWFELLEECMLASKERRRALRYSHNEGKTTDNNNITSSLDEWIAARQKIHMGRLPTESVSTRQETVKKRIRAPRDDLWEPPNFDNRLSLLTDIDISSSLTYDGGAGGDSTSASSTVGGASTSSASYRLSDDVFCVRPPALARLGSFRSTSASLGGASSGGGAATPVSPKRTLRAPTKGAPPPIQVSRRDAVDVDRVYFKFRERSYSDIQRV